MLKVPDSPQYCCNFLFKIACSEWAISAGAFPLNKGYPNNLFSSVLSVEPTVATSCSTYSTWLLQCGKELAQNRLCDLSSGARCDGAKVTVGQSFVLRFLVTSIQAVLIVHSAAIGVTGSDVPLGEWFHHCAGDYGSREDVRSGFCFLDDLISNRL